MGLFPQPLLRYDKQFYKTAMTIGIPIIIENIIGVSLNMIDTLMIGRLGEFPLAAVGAANRVSFIFIMICFGFFSGSSVLVSQYWGIKDVANIRRILGFDYAYSLAVSLIFMLLAQFLAPQLLGLFADEPEVIADGVAYLEIVYWSFPLSAISFAIAFNSRCIHRLIVPTVINALALGANTFLNWCLIYGNLGMPEWGVKGAAVATVIARLLEMLALLGYIYLTKGHPLGAKLHELIGWSRALLKHIFITALPVLISETAWSLGTSIYYVAYGKIGASALAVVQVAGVVNDLFSALFFGIGNASAVMIGNVLGQGNKELAFDYSKTFLKMTLFVCVITSLGFLFSRNLIIDMYDFSAETNLTMYKTFFVYAVFITPRMLTYMLFIGVLRAGGDTKFCMICDLLCVWCIGIPLSFFSVLVLHWSLPMVMALSFLEEVVKTVICLKRMRSKKWLNVLV
ncbi:MAG: MATE family efflux transporter [Bacillota bacterium]|nr:MATE family efflux transporter [Bacillota bacterium]